MGPFFQLKNGGPLTRACFVHKVRAALQAVGLPYDQFAGHSFRIGAATTAAKAGVEDSKIRMYDGEVEQYHLPGLHKNPKGGTGQVRHITSQTS